MRYHAAPIVLGLLATLAQPAPAQELWPGFHPSSFRFDIEKPLFDAEVSDQVGFLSATYRPAVRLRAGKARVTADMPVAVLTGTEGGNSDVRLGNPYLGVEIGKEDGLWMLQLGGRAPLADFGDDGDGDGEALILGMITDWNRWETWVPDAIPLTGTFLVQHRTEQGLTVAGRAGVTMAILTGEDYEDDTETLANYGLRFGYEKDRALLGITLTGRFLLTEDGDDQSHHRIGIDGGYRFGAFMPIVGVAIPLDDNLLAENLNAVISLGLKAWW